MAGHRSLSAETTRASPDAAAVHGQRGQVVLLPGQRGTVVPDQGGEVPDRENVVGRADPLHQPPEIQPEVAVLILRPQAVVQVEPVDVGDDRGQAAPRTMIC
jgi:hypothetical protein